jgi:hypothetical protein
MEVFFSIIILVAVLALILGIMSPFDVEVVAAPVERKKK